MSWNIFSSSAQVPKVVMLWWLVRGVGRAEGRSDALLFGFVVLLLTVPSLERDCRGRPWSWLRVGVLSIERHF